MRKPTVTVRVPATTANLGPGFDTLGIALKLHNHIAIRETDEPAVELVGATKGKDNPAANAMVRGLVDAFFQRAKTRPHGLQVEIKGDVPMSRGLGSSVTVRLGVAYALNEVNGRPLADSALLDLVSELEGHPDNCAPALFGGFVVAGTIGGSVRHRRFNVPSTLKFICCTPELEIATSAARALLPQQVPLADAVANLNRAALLTATFASGEFSLLRGLFEDRLHQPYRQKLLPQLDDVIAAGVGAGALGGWLSGSGSSIMCVAEHKEKEIAAAMRQALTTRQVRCETHILIADNDGTRVKRG